MSRTREGNDPKRRFARVGAHTELELHNLTERLVYDGEGHHKLHPGDYGFDPPVAPRPSKDVCDEERTVLRSQARDLFAGGIRKGMVSDHALGENPKYVWSVGKSPAGVVEVWEAKESGAKPNHYHGYQLRRDTAQRDYVLSEWNKRCRRS